MAFSYHDYTGDNSTTQFSIPFTYQNTSEISVTVDGVAQTGLTFPSSSTVQLTSAPASGTLVQVRRTTDLTARAVDFASGSVLTEEDLDDSSIQTFHASQEAIDRANDSIALDTDDKWDATSKVIKNVATPTANTDAANKSYVDTGANNAATSAAAALVSQNAAAASATAAANSATAAAGSATTAASEATDSANSATASASSATASANSASAASTSESNAATSAATATTQAALATTNGAAQVSLATTQANNAAASATTASTQAANASSSASTAATQATNSATSATASSSSATAAANSATAAATSETNAANSAAAAAAAFDNFDDTYLGSKTSDPTTDNDGDPLTQGDLYFNSTANEMRVYDGANWIAASSAGAASLILYEYTATSGQTTFSGADDNSASLSYSVGNIQVVMNGVVLDPSDYTATSGTSVVLGSGATTGDLVNIYAFKSFTVADTVSASAGGTFNGNVNFSDNVKAQFGAGSDLQIFHDGSNSYVSEQGTGNLNVLGTSIDFLNSAANKYYMSMSDGGSLTLYHNGGSKLTTTSTGVDVTGTVTADGLTVDSGSGVTFSQEASGSPYPEQKIKWSNDSTTANGFYVSQDTSRNGRVWHEQGLDVLFGTANTERMRIDSSGNVGIGTTSPTGKLTISEANGANAPTTISAANTYLHLGSGDFGASNNGKFMIGFGYTNGTANTNSPAYIGYQETSTGGNTKGVLTFHTRDVTTDTAPTEHLRIDSAGRIAHATGGSHITAGGGTPRYSMNFQATSGPGLVIQDTTATNGNAFVRFVNAGTYAGQISSNGGTSMTYGSASDHRLKENVEDMTDAITRVKSLQPRRFSWIADNLDAPNFDGFLAHEAQAVVPEAVTGTKDAMRDEEYEVTPAVLDDDGNVVTEAVMGTRSVPDYQGIDQSKLVPLLTGALREAIAKIEALETSNADLIARIETLENA